MTEDWLSDVAERIDDTADYGADQLRATERQVLVSAATIVRQLAEADRPAAAS